MRGIARGKTRLAAALATADRARLNRWLLAHTLAVIERWRGDLAHCLVVSPCAEVLDRARGAGAEVLREAEGEQGLNGALASGAAIAGQRGAERVLVLPCDLPELTVESLAMFVEEAARPEHMVIAPDRSRAGTNALLVPAGSGAVFHFGERSFTRHVHWATERGWTNTICARPDLEFDLDTPQDLAEWQSRRDPHAPLPFVDDGVGTLKSGK